MRFVVPSVFVGATFALALLSAAPAAERPRTADAETTRGWLGWRGLIHEGHTSASLPLQWDAHQGIIWKVPIPGLGHSSPIVDAQHVYVSTAFPETVGWAATALDAAIVGFATLLVVLAIERIFHLSLDEWSHHVLIQNAGTIALSLTLFLCAWLGDGLFDFPRCDIRGWLASALFCTLSWALTIFHTRSRSVRLMQCAGALALAAAVGIGVPSRDHAFRGGVLALNAQVVFATCSIPVLLGVVTCCRITRWRGKRMLAVAGIAAAMFALALFVRHVLYFKNVSLLEVSYQPKIGAWPIATLSGLAFLAIYWSRARTGARFAAAVSVAALALVGSVALFEQLASRSNYVAYHIGTLKFTPRFGDSTGLTVAVALVSFYAMVRLLTIQSDHAKYARLVRQSLCACALVLAGCFFARVNYVPAESQLARAIVAVARTTGAVEWVASGLRGARQVVDGRNSQATPTPVADGEDVCAYFGNPGLMCVDRDGRHQWSRTDLTYTGFYGTGFSPVLSNGLVVLSSDSADGSAIVSALDVRTGELVWRQTYRSRPTVSGNNRTPLVKTVRGEPTLIVWGGDYLKGFRLRTGDPVWEYAVKPGGDLVSSAISDDERLYLSDVTGTVALDITALTERRDPVKWRSPVRANCASPVICRQLVVTVTDTGIVSALARDTGRVVWRKRLTGFFFASPVSSDDAVYLTNSDGATTVLSCETETRILATNDVEEPVFASMAAFGPSLFLRGTRHLYMIGR